MHPAPRAALRRWCASLLAGAALAALAGAASGDETATAAALRPGAAVERALAGGSEHLYRIAATAGQNLLVIVEQRELDVEIAVAGPDGETFTVDTPSGTRGKESLLIAAAAGGDYQIAVRAPGTAATTGRYAIRVEELRAGSPEEDARLAAEQLMSEAGRLHRQGGAAARREAVARWREAASRWRDLGRADEEAWALQLTSRALRRLGEAKQALAVAEEALVLWQRLGDRVRQAESLTVMGLVQWSLGENGEAQGLLERALPLWRQLGDVRGEASARNNLCLILHSQGELKRALPCYEQALELFRAVGAPAEEAGALNNIGGVWEAQGEPQRALDPYRRALALYDAAQDRRGQAQVLVNLAAAQRGLGELGEALEHYGRALAIYREVGDRAGEGRTLNNIGFAYSSLGEPRRSLAYFEQALPLLRAAGDRRAEAATLSNLGRVRFRLGAVAEALEHYRQALALARAVGDRRDEGAYLVLLGQGYRAAGDLAQARESFAAAAVLQREVGDRRGEASALRGAGEVHAALGEPDQALADLGRALALQRTIGNRSGEVETLVALAAVERRGGRPDEAWSHVEQALAGIESLRVAVDALDLRASYLASQQQAFELAIGLQMELHRRAPAAGHDRLALALSERARARSLLELLQEARADIRQGVDPALRERERLLTQRLRAKTQHGVDLFAGSPTAEQRLAFEQERQELLAAADQLDAELRRSSPRYAELVQPRPLGAAEIQALLDPETLLLEYSLGEERSFLWAVESDAIAVFDLPPRAEVEAATVAVYSHLRTLDAAPPEAEREAGAALSRLLLGPVAERLGQRRLVVVGDGALHYLPFAALPAPAADAAAALPLIAEHEILALPSASVLAEQRRERREHRSAPGSVAVFADPVFQARDTRVRRPASAATSAAAAPDPAGTRPAGEGAGRSFQRLPWSRREAEAITKLAPAGSALLALDFRASRATALGEDLARYRIVHFATHGVIDAETPALSGLALSMVDEDGRPQEGFLSLSDLHNLRLDADLVVLSGCETALGREVRGEGLLGLTRGFLYAGAERVVASLWPIEDRGTAELMSRLYRELLAGGRTPAAALRAAQLALRENRRWHDPYYWAGFVLQGDWR